MATRTRSIPHLISVLALGISVARSGAGPLSPLTPLSLPSNVGNPIAISRGPDQNKIYYLFYDGPAFLGSYDFVSKQATQVALNPPPTRAPELSGNFGSPFIYGSHGAFWLREDDFNTILRINLDGSTKELTLPDTVQAIGPGGDGNLWAAGFVITPSVAIPSPNNVLHNDIFKIDFQNVLSTFRRDGIGRNIKSITRCGAEIGDGHETCLVSGGVTACTMDVQCSQVSLGSHSVNFCSLALDEHLVCTGATVDSNTHSTRGEVCDFSGAATACVPTTGNDLGPIECGAPGVDTPFCVFGMNDAAAVGVIDKTTTVIQESEQSIDSNQSAQAVALAGTNAAMLAACKSGSNCSGPARSIAGTLNTPEGPSLTIEKTTLGTLSENHLALSSQESSVRLASSVVFTITITNTGNAPTIGPVTVTDALDSHAAPDPNETKFANPSDISMKCVLSGKTITCTTTTPIPPGQSVQIVVYNIYAASVGDLPNKASVSGGGDIVTGTKYSNEVYIDVLNKREITPLGFAGDSSEVPGRHH